MFNELDSSHDSDAMTASATAAVDSTPAESIKKGATNLAKKKGQSMRDLVSSTLTLTKNKVTSGDKGGKKIQQVSSFTSFGAEFMLSSFNNH